MRNYTEPKLEIVTLEVSDVITASAINFGNMFEETIGSNENGGHASMAQYEI